MKIKTALTLKFTAIVAGILILFSIFTYEFSEIFRKNEFTDRLRNVSRNVVINYLDKEELTPSILRLIYEKQLNRFPQERLIIADEHHVVIFASKPAAETELDLLEKLYKTNNEIEINKKDTEYCAYIVHYNTKNYFIVSSAIDVVGQQKLKFLRYLLLVLNIACVFISFLFGFYFSKQSLQPIKKVIAEVDTINESNLHQRVNEGNGTDEIAKLAIVFNKMLARIEKSFDLQKMFVANASHEFRTPLTAMKGQIEVLLLQPRTEKEYLAAFDSIQEDIQNSMLLLNGLTELASANAEFPNITFQQVSIVEAIMDAREDLLKRKPNYKISIDWDDFPEDENAIQIMGDFALMNSVFINLMDNACKFSADKTSVVKVCFKNAQIFVSIIDKGEGISKKDLPLVFQAFYRSNDTRKVPGYGIGLSLVKKTLELHKGTISISSEAGLGTEVSLVLPSVAAQNQKD